MPADPRGASFLCVFVFAFFALAASACSHSSPPDDWTSVAATCADAGDGECIRTLATGPLLFPGPNVAVDSQHVYWTADDLVLSIPVGGGAIATLASGQSGATSIAVDSTSIYWTNDDITTTSHACGGPLGNGVLGGNCPYDTYGPGTVMKMPLSGGTAVTLASGQSQPTLLHVSATNVYWKTLVEGLSPNTVLMVPLTGGTPTTLATGDLAAVVADSANLYWVPDTSAVVQEPFGGAPITIADTYQETCGLAVDATNVYWSTESDYLFQVPIGGGTVTTLVVGVPTCELVSDGTSVYFAGLEGLMKVPVGGGDVTTLAPGPSMNDLVVGDISDVVVGSTSVFWMQSLPSPSNNLFALEVLTPK